MGHAIEKLTNLVRADERYDIPFSELRAPQIEAVNERFQDRKGRIKLLAHRARQAGLTEIRTGEEITKVLFPHTAYKYEGRAGFFDLSLDGRWGGVISGDRVSIDFSPCACGARSPSIRDNIVRFADVEGDDKIGCAGTVDAYVRGVS